MGRDARKVADEIDNDKENLERRVKETKDQIGQIYLARALKNKKN